MFTASHQHPRLLRPQLQLALVLTIWLLSTPRVNGEPPIFDTVRDLRRFAAPEAHQAVAVDADSVYAIANRSVARYSKDGQRLGDWTAPDGSPVQHLNSGFVRDGKLYCANSNWPAKPLKNTVEIFELPTLRHHQRLTFEESEGAINWIVRHQHAWWIVFAFYGESEVRRTRLVKYDDDWNEIARWSFPESVIRRFLPNSNSGGAFGPDGKLYVTGHDHAELYVLSVPHEPGTLTHETTIAASIAGQGIAWDATDIGTLYGIVRRTHEVTVMRLSHATEYAALRRPLRWVRHPANPILPPRSGEFDSARCMNPWVVSDGREYRLYYSGGDSEGLQRIAVATASVDDVTSWKRSGPLFETGSAGSFDARWCVLPHVIQTSSTRWNMYYTGNAGTGAGLSAFPGIGLATSSDGLSWQRTTFGPVLAPSRESGRPDAIGIAGGSVLRIPQADGRMEWRLYYTGCPTIGKALPLNQQKTICLAVSSDGKTWRPQGAVMLRDPDRDYENIGVAGPVVHREPDGLYRMWYSAIGTRWGYYSICYAESDDGFRWRRGTQNGDNLQLTPRGEGWESQMVEYPSLIREGDRWRLFYCGNGYGRTGIGTALSEPEPAPGK